MEGDAYGNKAQGSWQGIVLSERALDVYQDTVEGN